jgi:hypothetical protein
MGSKQKKVKLKQEALDLIQNGVSQCITTVQFGVVKSSVEKIKTGK